jgi:L-methionine (R)-S-oxide reductase
MVAARTASTVTDRHAKVIERVRALAESADIRKARARSIAEAIREAGAYHWVGLYDVTATRVEAIAWTGAQPPAHPVFPVAQGLTGAAIAAGEPAIVQDVSRDARCHPIASGTTFAGSRAEAIFPVIVDGATVGTINVESDRVDAFTPQDEQFLRDCTRAILSLWVDDTIDEL